MDLAGWFSQTCHRAPALGFTAAGVATFGSTVAFQARVESTVKLIRGKDGQEIVSSQQIGTLAAVGEQDRIWLPGEDSTNATIAHVPLKVAQATNKGGAQVYVQVWLA